MLRGLGDKGALVVAQIASACKWAGIALALTKWQVYVAEVVGSLAFMSLPVISGLKANAVRQHEQGALQGALSGVQALASGIGPVLFYALYRCDIPCYSARAFARALRPGQAALRIAPGLPSCRLTAICCSVAWPHVCSCIGT